MIKLNCYNYNTQLVGLLGIRLRIEGLLVRVSVSAESLCCVLEQDTIRRLVLVQLRKTGNCLDMTEKLLIGTQSIKANKQNEVTTVHRTENHRNGTLAHT